jgi:hypothetical protein
VGTVWLQPVGSVGSGEAPIVHGIQSGHVIGNGRKQPLCRNSDFGRLPILAKGNVVGFGSYPIIESLPCPRSPLAGWEAAAVLASTQIILQLEWPIRLERHYVVPGVIERGHRSLDELHALR